MDKTNAIKIVTECAQLFERELNGKSLIIFCLENKINTSTLELVFREEQFMHLTGIKPRNGKIILSAKRFYQKCLNNKLQQDEFDFSPDGTSEIKLEILPYILCKNLHANAIGDFNGSTIKLMSDKLIGNQRAFLGFINVYKDYYIPNTLIKGDIRDYAKNRKRIIAILRKEQNDKTYEEITYIAKNIDWNLIRFPEKYSELLNLIRNNPD